MKVLLKDGANPKRYLSYNCEELATYPVDVAMSANNLELIKFLLDNGAEIPPLIGYYENVHQNIYDFLIERNAKISNRLLHKFMEDSAEKGYGFVEHLLSKGLATPRICDFKNIADVEFMFSRGADINEECPIRYGYCEGGICWGTTLEHYAGINGNLEIIKFLIDKGAQVTNNSIKYAIDHGNVEIADILLEAQQKQQAGAGIDE
ncbi:MAG: ankyrin repeat domain-containing protein [Elusimicrobiota bacterium]|jgi:ankyrin repeat protein|nr:ankyrin repeat domain-containing protein [Elusimicrobiota bacterium]